MDRVKRGGKIIVNMGFVTAVILVAAIMIFGKNMLTLFTDTQEAVELGARMLRVMSVGYLGISFMQSYGGILRGAGDTMAVMWITIVTNVVLRVPIAYSLAALTKSAEYPAGHPDSVYLSMMISWVIGAILSFIYYRTGKWKNKAVVRRSEPPVQSEV
jgi:Na+-driven multidrug efflux pump